MNHLHKNPASSNWAGRESEEIEYWHQAVIPLNDLEFYSVSKSKKIGILGYAAEEGVKRNRGRIGTSDAPDKIRKMWGPLAFHLPDGTKILDYGNIHTIGEDMEASHNLISEVVYNLLQTHHFPVLLGGGHDLAYSHARGVYKYLESKQEKLGVINLDAHFDLRPLVDGRGHSGSPFFQLAQENPENFHYLCLGIQRSSNPKSLFETAEKLKAHTILVEDLTLNNWKFIEEKIRLFIDSVDKIYLSIDMDGFSSAYSPGVSAPSPLGFTPEIAFKIFELISKSKKIISLDVVELNPTYDQDNLTARLAARCVEYVIRNSFE
jgi:formiminoglutamase